MFSYCSNLKILDLSSFNTLNVTNMSYMFYNCENLNNLDLSSFNCTNITNAIGLFHGCQKQFIEHNKFIFKKYNDDILLKEEEKKEKQNRLCFIL